MENLKLNPEYLFDMSKIKILKFYFGIHHISNFGRDGAKLPTDASGSGASHAGIDK
jgi:hypothetical protein